MFKKLFIFISLFTNLAFANRDYIAQEVDLYLKKHTAFPNPDLKMPFPNPCFKMNLTKEEERQQFKALFLESLPLDVSANLLEHLNARANKEIIERAYIDFGTFRLINLITKIDSTQKVQEFLSLYNIMQQALKAHVFLNDNHEAIQTIQNHNKVRCLKNILYQGILKYGNVTGEVKLKGISRKIYLENDENDQNNILDSEIICDFSKLTKSLNSFKALFFTTEDERRYFLSSNDILNESIFELLLADLSEPRAKKFNKKNCVDYLIAQDVQIEQIKALFECRQFSLHKYSPDLIIYGYSKAVKIANKIRNSLKGDEDLEKKFDEFIHAEKLIFSRDFMNLKMFFATVEEKGKEFHFVDEDEEFYDVLLKSFDDIESFKIEQAKTHDAWHVISIKYKIAE